MKKTLISCKSLAKQFHVVDGNHFWKILFNRYDYSIDALKNISLEVPKGEFVGILGRNGSGKSTFLRVVGGVYSPTQGVVNLTGNLSAIYELGVTSSDFLTGRKFSERWLEFCNQCPRQDLKRIIDEIHDFSELENYFDEPMFKYSTGMKARLFFSVATAIPGKIYLIDEVLSVGDEYFQAKCWRRLRDYFWNGASGILVTHDWSAVIKLCANAYIFEKGEIIESGKSTEVVRKYLNLERPKSETVIFTENLPTVFHCESLKDLEILLPIQVQKTGKVSIGYSIEIFGVGEGWEHLLHMDPSPTNITTPGHYQIHLKIPRLPLASGEYSLNLFLFREDEMGNLVTTDVRSWTYGNELKLIVGEGGRGSIRLPLKWQIEAA